MAEKNTEKTITLKVDASLYKENLKIVLAGNEEQKKSNKEVMASFEKIEKVVALTSKTMKGLRSSMYTLKEVSVKDLSAITSSTVDLQQTIGKLAPLNDKLLASYEKTNKTALEAMNAEIAVSKTKTDALNKLVETHKAKDLALREQSEIAKRRVEEEYKKGVEKAELSAEEIVAVEEDKAKRIALIDAQLKQEVEQNAKDLQANVKEVRTNMLNELTKETQETITHTGGLWKGVMDVGATSKQYDTAIDALKKYKNEMANTEKGIESHYQWQMKNAEANMRGITDIENEKAEKLKEFKAFEAEEIKRVNAEIEKLEKSSHNLRLQQFNQYVEKYKALNTKISDATQAASKAFGQLGAMYKDDVAEIDQEIANNTTEKYEAEQEFEANKQEHEAKNLELQKEIDAETLNMNQATTEEDKKLSQERISTLQSEMVTKDSVSAEFEAKNSKLENDKRKAEKKAKEAENIQKKIDLGQQIATSIGDIAAGTAKAWSYGPILGPILATIVAAAGAMQVGIMTKQLAKFEDGGLLRGKRHRDGGMRIEGSNIEVEGGEYVVNRKSTARNLGLLRYINGERRELDADDLTTYFAKPFALPTFGSPFAAMMEQGGQVPMLPTQIDISNSELLAGIQNMKIEPRVSVTDINHVHQQMTQVDEWVGM